MRGRDRADFPGDEALAGVALHACVKGVLVLLAPEGLHGIPVHQCVTAGKRDERARLGLSKRRASLFHLFGPVIE